MLPRMHHSRAQVHVHFLFARQCYTFEQRAILTEKVQTVCGLAFYLLPIRFPICAIPVVLWSQKKLLQIAVLGRPHVSSRLFDKANSS